MKHAYEFLKLLTEAFPTNPEDKPEYAQYKHNITLTPLGLTISVFREGKWHAFIMEDDADYALTAVELFEAVKHLIESTEGGAGQ